MHHVENVSVLSFDLNADLLALSVKNFLQLDERNFALARLGKQNHVEEAVQDVLIDAENVDVVVGEDFRHGGDDADAIPSDHCHDKFHLIDLNARARARPRAEPSRLPRRSR